jgi:hypothetical protein
LKREARRAVVTHPNSPRREQREPSALVFVANVIFSSIAVVLAIVFLATMAPGARTSLVMAVTIGLVFCILVILAFSPRPPHRRPALARRAGVTGVFVAISALLIMLSFVVPPEFGSSLAILGLGGLFLVRLTAFRPRSPWRPPTRPIDMPPLQPTLYVSPGSRAWRRRRRPSRGAMALIAGNECASVARTPGLRRSGANTSGRIR